MMCARRAARRDIRPARRGPEPETCLDCRSRLWRPSHQNNVHSDPPPLQRIQIQILLVTCTVIHSTWPKTPSSHCLGMGLDGPVWAEGGCLASDVLSTLGVKGPWWFFVTLRLRWTCFYWRPQPLVLVCIWVGGVGAPVVHKKCVYMHFKSPVTFGFLPVRWFLKRNRFFTAKFRPFETPV